jgi:Baseplate J-like protein
MSISSLTFSQLQSLFFTQYSAVANTPANTNPGSTCWALGNAAALLAMNIQNELQYVQKVARLSTSVSTTPGVNSANVDTFVNPFGMQRIAATYASGSVTMTTPSVATAQITIPVGGIVSSGSGVTFVVIADPNNANYGYPINVGSSSTIVTVQCVIAGSAGNVQAGQINSVANSVSSPPIVGISSVTNAGAFTNGQNAEADTALQTRFFTAQSTGVVATDNALVAALLAVFPGTNPGIPGLIYSLGDGVNAAGSATVATVSVYVNYYNTGTATPSPLVTSVQNALNAVKPAGIAVTAYGPSIVPVNVSAIIHIPSGLNTTTVINACQAAYISYINKIGLNPLGGSTAANYYSIAAALLGVANVSKIDNLLTGINSLAPVYGTSTGANVTTLTDSTKSWTVNAYAGYTVTSEGSFGIVASNTATVLTITSWTGNTPATGSSYSITTTPAGTSDISAAFGNQLVAGSVSFTAAQP